MTPRIPDTTTVIEAAVADLQAVLPDGAVVAVVVRLPCRGYRVAAPSGQNPAATYGMLHRVVQRRGGPPTQLSY